MIHHQLMILEMKMESYLTCCLSAIQTEMRKTFCLLLSSLGTDFWEMCLIFILFGKICWTVPNDCPAISDTWWIVYLNLWEYSHELSLWFPVLCLLKFVFFFALAHGIISKDILIEIFAVSIEKKITKSLKDILTKLHWTKQCIISAAWYLMY